MQIPGLRGVAPGELAKRSVTRFFRDDMTTYAAALAYHVLFALFPFLIFLVALLSVLQIPGFFDWVLNQAQTAMPEDAFRRVEEVVGQVRNQARGGLLSFGIVVALWSASSGVRSLMNSLNAAYHVEESRPAWKRYPLSIIYTIGLAVMVTTAATLMLLGPRVMDWLAEQAGLGGLFVTLWTWLRWPLAVLLLILAAAVIYYVAPNVDQPFQIITPGSVIAVIAWVIASLGFSYYVSNIGNYSATYGSLGAVIILLFYFFISSAMLLLGAEVNAVIYHETQRQQGGGTGSQ